MKDLSVNRKRVLVSTKSRWAAQREMTVIATLAHFQHVRRCSVLVLGGCRTTMYRSLYWRRLNQAAGAAAECAPHISSLPAASCALCSRPSVDDVRLQHVDYYQIQMRENQSTNRHMHRQNREVDVIGACERSVPTH